MKLVALVCVCVVTRCGITAAGGTGPEVVEEGSDVILPCSLSNKENIQSKLFDWTKDGRKEDREVFLYDGGLHYNNGRSGQSERFRGRVSHFPEQLVNGDASIIIRNTKVADSGNYTCNFPRLHQIVSVELIVRASPEPYVRPLRPTEDGELLQCEVRGAFPEPRLQLQDSSGNILPAEEPQVSKGEGGRYNVILQVTVTKTDDYRCVATQEPISHQIYSDVYVSVNESSTGWIVAAVLGSVLFVVGVLVAVLVAKGRISLNCNKGSALETRDPQKDPNQLETPDPSAQHML